MMAISSSSNIGRSVFSQQPAISRSMVSARALYHGQALARREAVGRCHFVARAALPREGGDADHEELVEVVRGDGEKLDAFEQRVRVRLRLRENALVERKPAELAVDVQRRDR